MWTKLGIISVTLEINLEDPWLFLGNFIKYLNNASICGKSRMILFYLFISSLFKVDLHLSYKKPINVNNNTVYISVNKLPKNNNNNKTK